MLAYHVQHQEKKDQTVEDILGAVKEAGFLYHAAFQSMESNIDSNTDSMMYHLSKSNS